MKKRQHDKPTKFSYRDVERLIDTQLTGAIVLTGRARRSLKKAEYQDPQLVWRAVELLTTYYKVTETEFRRSCRELGLDYRRSITDVSAGMHGEKYFVDYNGKRRRLDFHLTKGSDREPRKCLRIYFFHDDDNERIVIGHLPSHLSNSKS
ncbi:MAG: hypothetical protein IJ774_07875 [Selenomonadaceae bacterium]|nr:hypothetical protein [Selenomonadaceae bacterium]